MNLNDAMNQTFPSPYLKKEDFPSPRQVTIDTFAIENVAPDGKPPEMKPVLYFNGAPKGMRINKTVLTVLGAILGNETDAWTGKQVEVFNDMTVVYDNKVGGLRIRPVQQVAQPIQAHANTNGIPPAAGPDVGDGGFNDDIPNW